MPAISYNNLLELFRYVHISNAIKIIGTSLLFFNMQIFNVYHLKSSRRQNDVKININIQHLRNTFYWHLSNASDIYSLPNSCSKESVCV